MDELKGTIRLRCSFCRSELFSLPEEEFVPSHGTFVVCANCGRENDVTSAVLVVKAKAMEMAKKHADKLVENFKKDLKKAFKGNKNIKIR